MRLKLCDLIYIRVLPCCNNVAEILATEVPYQTLQIQLSRIAC
jgi:hypothetical protein